MPSPFCKAPFLLAETSGLIFMNFLSWSRFSSLRLWALWMGHPLNPSTNESPSPGFNSLSSCAFLQSPSSGIYILEAPLWLWAFRICALIWDSLSWCRFQDSSVLPPVISHSSNFLALFYSARSRLMQLSQTKSLSPSSRGLSTVLDLGMWGLDFGFENETHSGFGLSKKFCRIAGFGV